MTKKNSGHDDSPEAVASDKRNVSVQDIDAQDVTEIPSRRRFIKGVGLSSLAAATGGSALNTWAQQSPSTSSTKAEPAAEGKVRVAFTVNGQKKQIDVAPNVILLDALRDYLGLTGTKKGCDHGQCGACNVQVNGKVINSCLSLAVMHEGDEITTVEGLAGSDNKLSPLQQAFHEHDAYQCGYCTSGQLMSADFVLRSEHIAADDAAVREAMSGNICRCAAYKNILSAIQSARGKV